MGADSPPARVRHLGAASSVLGRVLQIPVVLLVVSILVFWLVQVVPGDPGRNALGPYASVEQVAAWNAARGLDGAPVERYVTWMAGFFTGDWGVSVVYGVPVFDLVLERFGNSLALGLAAFVIVVPVAVAIGVAQASREGSRVDRSLTIATMSLAAVPEFVIGVLLMIGFGIVIPILPIQSGDGVGGGLMPHVRAMVLPALTLALGSLAVLARMTRTGVIEVTGSAFHRAAIIRGLHGVSLFRRHVARNALIPTVSVIGVYFGALLGGSAVVETLFGYPGLGELLVTAAQRKDVFVLAAGAMVTGFVSLLALLVTDVVLRLLDPRIPLFGDADG